MKETFARVSESPPSRSGFMRLTSASISIVIQAVLTLGCGASGPKMNAYAPIEKEPVFLGTAYEQGDAVLDRKHMTDTLFREPAARDDVSSYRALSTVAMIAAIAGGALVGWPAGVAIGGEEDPPWILAGIGAGAIVLSIPLGVVADNNLEDAVDAHNRKLGAEAALAPDGGSF
jgi:hypothetical protein